MVEASNRIGVMMTRFSTWLVAGMTAAFLAPFAVSHGGSKILQVQTENSGSCVIKGNISVTSGERIYHVPGQEYYAKTRISPQYGERWFCSEADARAAGWRKAWR